MCKAPSAPTLEAMPATWIFEEVTTRAPLAAVKSCARDESVAEGRTVAAVAPYENTGRINELTPTRARNLGKRPTDFSWFLRDFSLFVI